MKNKLNSIGQFIKEYYGVLFFCIIITGFFYSFFIDKLSDKLYSQESENVTIYVYFDEIYSDSNWIEIRDFVTNEDLWQRITDSEKSEEWYGQTLNGCRRWTIKDLNGQAYISFPGNTSGKVDISCGGGKGIAKVVSGNSEVEYTLLDDSGDTIIPIYKNWKHNIYKKATVINVITFGIAYLIILAASFTLILGSINIIKNKRFIDLLYSRRTLILIACLYVLWAYIGYIYGIEQYTTGYGDQGWYWRDYLSVNPFKTAQMLDIDFRGYISAWIPVVCIRMGSLLGIQGEIIWILYLCIIHIFAFGIAIPYIYECFTGNKPKAYQILGINLVYLLFWGYNVMAKLSDAGGWCFFIIGIWAYCKFKNTSRLLYMLMAGVCFSAAISYRMAYKFGLTGLLILVACRFFISWFAKNNKPIWNKVILGIIFFGLGVIFVSLPQLVCNIKNGVVSLFPVVPTYENGVSFSAESASGSLNGVLVFGYPYGCRDQSLKLIADRFGAQSQDGVWSMDIILCMFSAQWMDAMVFITKKLFFGMSTIKDIAFGSLITGYPASRYPYAHGSSFAIIPMINYFLMGSSIYCLAFCKKVLTKKEKFFWSIALLTLVLPQTLVHVEWRYFFVGYLFIYYVFFFTFMNRIEEIVKEEKISVLKNKVSSFFFFEGVFILICETMLWTFY